MVNMSMTQDQVIDFRRIEAKVPVHGIGIHSFALVHAAIQKYLLSIVQCYQVLTAGNFSGGS
jgi:hypothetical protein